MRWFGLRNLCVLLELILLSILCLDGATLIRQAMDLPIATQRLCVAAAAGNLDELHAALDEHPDVNACNSFGDPPLVSAACFGPPDVLKALLQAGANVNQPGMGHTTALMRAVYGRRMDLITILLQAGADPSLKDDDGLTALSAAQTLERTEVADFLKRYQAHLHSPAPGDAVSAPTTRPFTVNLAGCPDHSRRPSP
jgi:Ankyrin repeats (many copies)